MKSAKEWPHSERGEALLMKRSGPTAHLAERSPYPTLPRKKKKVQ